MFQSASESACMYSGKRVFRIDSVVDRIGRMDCMGGWEVDRTLAARRACVQAFSWAGTGQLFFSRIEACHLGPVG